MKILDYDCYLVDDGTLDTVISVNGSEYRYDGEYASLYRDNDGSLTEEGFRTLCDDAIDQYELDNGLCS